MNALAAQVMLQQKQLPLSTRGTLLFAVFAFFLVILQVETAYLSRGIYRRANTSSGYQLILMKIDSFRYSSLIQKICIIMIKRPFTFP